MTIRYALTITHARPLRWWLREAARFIATALAVLLLVALAYAAAADPIIA